MLSGGERALTAVALLFAMLEVRPVPFCVLDEVDAALDEANVGRFTSALRELAARTQFIVITHNRGTIEAADALYGVTVGDDSVSRVISLRLDEAQAIADRPGQRHARRGLLMFWRRRREDDAEHRRPMTRDRPRSARAGPGRLRPRAGRRPSPSPTSSELPPSPSWPRPRPRRPRPNLRRPPRCRPAHCGRPVPPVAVEPGDLDAGLARRPAAASCRASAAFLGGEPMTNRPGTTSRRR